MAIKTVLVVDDSQTDLHVMTGMLSKNGFSVIQATSGESAIEVARAEKPDLILMDIVMPGMNGFETTRKLSRDPETSHIPVIIVSTKGQETDKVWGMRQGAKDYLVKPVAEAVLISKIRAL